MFARTGILVVLLPALVSADYTWPNAAWDELESLTHVQSGLFRSGILDGITPCTDFPPDHNPARQASSEWLRTAFHDAISHSVEAGTGGMDASLLFETLRPENLGARSFNDTFGFMSGFYSTRASMADLIALAAYTAVRGCQGPPLVMRVGRVDAAGPAPEGRVPEPKDSIKTMLKKFADAGFNQQDMIQMVACGHTLGGVHGEFFPELTGDNSNTSFSHFDTTSGAFDNRVVTEYLDSTTQNPLVTAPRGNNSDFAVFSSDGNSTMKAMSPPKTFLSTCGSILQRMIDTVPSSVALSPPLAPLTVKPHLLQLQIVSTGDLQLDGYIRVKDDGTGEPLNVTLAYSDRAGKQGAGIIGTIPIRAQGGMGFGYEASFRFYQIDSTILPNGISSFNVSVTSASGNTTVYTNNGGGYPVEDTIIYQSPQSCLVQKTDANGNWNLTLVAAVRDGAHLGSPSMSVDVQSDRPGTTIPLLTTQSAPMKLWRNTTAGYTLYTGSYSLPIMSWSTKAGVWVEGADQKRYEDGFKATSALGDTCAGF